MIYIPRRYTAPLNTTSLANFELTPLWFQTEDGNQSAVVLKQKGAAALRATFVFGGNAMTARDWILLLLPLFQYFDDTVFVLVDYPGYGFSEGKPSQEAIKRAAVTAVDEAERLLSKAGTKMRFGALGHSLGCAAALHLAVSQQNTGSPLERVALSAPFTSLAQEAQFMLPFLKVIPTWLIAKLTARNEWDNLIAVSSLANSISQPRIDIIHGESDSIVPYVLGQQLWRHINTQGLETTFQSTLTDHNDILGSDEYMDWLRTVLW